MSKAAAFIPILLLTVLGLSGCSETTGQSRPELTRQASSVAEGACLAAVRRQTNNNDLSIIGSEFSEANSLVMVGVGPQRAPWRCLVSNSGVVAEVTSVTNEGAL